MIEELTAEILAAEKKAYGKVIRMMAHEVNNTIGPVNSILASTLQATALWQQSNQLPYQNALQVAFDRNNNLNIFMRNFADVVRLPAPKKSTIDLNQLVRAVIVLMEIKAGEKQVRFIDHLAAIPIYISGDEQQLEQVLINIVKNALESIEGRGEIIFTSPPLKKG